MSVDKIKELEGEYERLKAAAAKELDDAGAADVYSYSSTQLARTRLGDFCLTTGNDLTLLHPLFNEEDLAFANVGA